MSASLPAEMQAKNLFSCSLLIGGVQRCNGYTPSKAPTTMQIQYWFHYDIYNAVGHVLAMADSLPTDSTDASLVHGYRYADVGMFPQDFVGDALQMDSSDGDSIIMAAEMQGNEHVWQRIDETEFSEIVERGSLMGSTRTKFSGYRIEDDRAFATTGHEYEPELSPCLVVQ